MRTFFFSLALLAGLAGCTTEDRDSEIYEGCESKSECSSEADECYTVAFEVGRDGAMCSKECTTDGDCPRGGKCYELVGDVRLTRICYERCNTEADCDGGFICADAVNDDDVVEGHICLPE